MAKHYDLAIIGSGPGGYVGALYASSHKLNVCVIEKDLLGGTCLNRGCIPTKSLLNCASLLSNLKSAGDYGIEIPAYSLNFEKAVGRKDEVVSRLRSGIETLFRARHIDLVRGKAGILDPHTISVEGAGNIQAKHIIIASGSSPAELPGIKIDEQKVLSSDGILELKSVPRSLVIIGGGVIGCEFASLFNSFGTKVTIVEFLDKLIAGQSREASKKLEILFKKRGADIFTSAKAESIAAKDALKIAISGRGEIEAEKVLVAVGRRPNTEDLGIEKIGIHTEKGRINVDGHLRTNIRNIYAIGDCINGPLLAHKASYDGILACDNILGNAREADYSNIPSCIWTEPEIASIGLSEEDAKARCKDAKVAKFPYLGSGKAYIEGKTEGFVKIIGDARGDILGVEIFGKGACDLIGEAVLARTTGVNIKDWAHVVHGHPTLSEMLQEAAHIFCGAPIHGI